MPGVGRHLQTLDMKRIPLFVFFLPGFFLKSPGQSATNQTSIRISMDASLGPAMLKQCSRATPRYVSGFWTASQADIADMENNLFKIDSLIATECCVIGAKIEDSKNYAFQCVGV